MCGWAIGWERSVCWRPWDSPGRSRCCIGDGAREKRETRNAERGTGRLEVDSGHDIPRTTCVRSVPRSAFRVPRCGGVGGGGVVRVGVDVGGTFTDLVALTPDGTIEVRKVATTPEDPALGMFRALDTLGTRDEGRGTSAATSPPVPRPHRHADPRYDHRDQRAAGAARCPRGARHDPRVRGPAMAQTSGSRGTVRPGTRP